MELVIWIGAGVLLWAAVSHLWLDRATERSTLLLLAIIGAVGGGLLDSLVFSTNSGLIGSFIGALGLTVGPFLRNNHQRFSN